MFQSINRNNRLFMLGNFLFALSYGLWMNLRQLHLGNLGATPAEIGTALGIVALAGGILPVPVGHLTDRIGPKRVILGAWLLATLGTLIAALATTWSLAGVGFAPFMLVIAANPATVAFVLLNTPDQITEGQAEHVMATVFATWPAAMVFAPTLGGVIADRFGIGTDLWLGALGIVVAVGLFSRTNDIRPTQNEDGGTMRTLMNNRRFLALAAFFPLALIALYVGYTLAPTYLQGVRGYSVGSIGALFSILSAGSLAANYVVGKVRPQWSFVVLIGAVWVGTLLLWQTDTPVLTGVAFALLGATSTMWLLTQTSFGQLVRPEQRGLALGITESLAYLAMAVAAWLAGQLY
jgi:MFS family permease